MNNTIDQQAAFFTLVRSARARASARVLIDSIRSFAGALKHSPIWVFERNEREVACAEPVSDDVSIFPLRIPDKVSRYFYADKVHACVQAEQMAGSSVRSLIWMSVECLLVNPPPLLQLDDSNNKGVSADAAVRPVHITNVGIPPTQPLDGFWKGVCNAVGIDDIERTVETFVDKQRIRSYFNSHTLSVNPKAGLFEKWGEVFDELVQDNGFQASACQDERHQVFLHQAVLSVVLLAALDPSRIRLLPPEYSYPYNLQQSLPKERRAKRLNDLVSIAYDERSLDPRVIDDIAIDEPLRKWLSDRAASLGSP